MSKSMSFQEWFEKRSGKRTLMMVSSRVYKLPCGCRVYRNIYKGTAIHREKDGSWVHDCEATKTITVVVPKPLDAIHPKSCICHQCCSY
ncbi:MAG TPA: hypothetical protein VGO63_04115 [Candidatus Paceibacterota bacterium]|jgi:hypothetical protein|nr:hypothetical protein [Candidatus Paceibacterota bacterium]